MRQLALSYVESTVNMDGDILNFFLNPPKHLKYSTEEYGSKYYDDSQKESEKYFKENKEFLKNLGKYLKKNKISPRGFFIWIYDTHSTVIKLKGLENPDKVTTITMSFKLETYLSGLYNDRLAEQKTPKEPKIDIKIKKI